MAGYSATPLTKKLGIKRGFKLFIINAPDYYFDLFTGMPDQIEIVNDNRQVKKNLIHLFIKSMSELDENIVTLKNEIVADGMIWISWYKRSSGITTNVTEDKIRAVVLANGLVDIKVCAIDENWSGLKLVVPIQNRK